MSSALPLSRKAYHNGACLLAVLAAILVLYFPILSYLSHDWSTNDNYSHGFFVPLVSLLMVFSIREDLQRIPFQPSNWGLPVLLLGLAQLWVARVGSEYFLQRTSLVLVLLGCVLFLLGRRMTWRVLLPLAYLLFMVPLPEIIWNKIAFPMQLFSSAITEDVVRMIGIPIYREGNILQLASTTLEVVDACSGLRSLTTMFALSAALAWFVTCPAWKKWLLFFAAAPIAIFANMVRLTATAVLASFYGEKVAQGFLHEFSGLFTFVLGLLLLILVSGLLQKNKKVPQT